MSDILVMNAATREQARLAINEALSYASIVEDFTIENDDDAALANEQLRALVKFRKTTEETRVSETRPLLALQKEIIAEFNPALEKATEAETILRRLLTTYTQEQIAAARRRQAEADEIARKDRQAAQERLEAEQRRAEALTTPKAQERAQERIAEAAAAVEVAEFSAPIAVPAAPKMKGFSLRDNWQPEITDGTLAELVAAAAKDRKYLRFLALDMPAINKTIKAMTTDADIPGVRAVNNQSSAVR